MEFRGHFARMFGGKSLEAPKAEQSPAPPKKRGRPPKRESDLLGRAETAVERRERDPGILARARFLGKVLGVNFFSLRLLWVLVMV